jgi:hypothetical protein
MPDSPIYPEKISRRNALVSFGSLRVPLPAPRCLGRETDGNWAMALRPEIHFQPVQWPIVTLQVGTDTNTSGRSQEEEGSLGPLSSRSRKEAKYVSRLSSRSLCLPFFGCKGGPVSATAAIIVAAAKKFPRIFLPLVRAPLAVISQILNNIRRQGCSEFEPGLSSLLQTIRTGIANPAIQRTQWHTTVKAKRSGQGRNFPFRPGLSQGLLDERWTANEGDIDRGPSGARLRTTARCLQPDTKYSKLVIS